MHSLQTDRQTDRHTDKRIAVSLSVIVLQWHRVCRLCHESWPVSNSDEDWTGPCWSLGHQPRRRQR